jgi:hypothetical protein
MDGDFENEVSAMTKQVTVDLTSLGEQSMEIPGLGVFENGTTTDVTDEMLATFESQGYIWPEDSETLVYSDDEWPEAVAQSDPDAPSDLVVEVDMQEAIFDEELGRESEDEPESPTPVVSAEGPAEQEVAEDGS